MYKNRGDGEGWKVGGVVSDKETLQGKPGGWEESDEKTSEQREQFYMSDV